MIDLIKLDTDGRVNSGYGPRKSPTAGASSNHKGIDLSLKSDKVPAVVSGTVIENKYNSARGYYITIKGSDGYTTRYQHLAEKSPLKVGTKVQEGEVIGTQGSTGASTGKHLHFEVMTPSGAYVDPEKYLSGATNLELLESSDTYNKSGVMTNNGVKWWGDVVICILCALLVIGGAVMLVLGVTQSSLVKGA